MRKLTFAIASTLVTAGAFGQDPLECVDQDVLNGVIFNGSSASKMSITRTLPSDMQGFQAPAGFDLIGTGIRAETGLTQTAFRTSLPSADAHAAIVEALSTDGWEVEDEQRPPQTFNVASAPRPAVLCRDAERRLVEVQDTAGTRYATVTLVPDYSDRRACHAEDPRLTRAPGMLFRDMSAGMPTFDFPPTTQPAAGAGLSSGMSGSGNTLSTSSRIRSPDTASSLAEHLGAHRTGLAPGRGLERFAERRLEMDARRRRRPAELGHAIGRRPRRPDL